MNKLKGFPVGNHPQFGEYWGCYSNAFNKLAEQLNNKQIKELHAVINAAQDIERLSFRYNLPSIIRYAVIEATKEEKIDKYIINADQETLQQAAASSV